MFFSKRGRGITIKTGLPCESLQLVSEMLFLLKELYSLDCYCNNATLY